MKQLFTILLLFLCLTGSGQYAEITGIKGVADNSLTISVIDEKGVKSKTDYETMVAAMNAMAKQGYTLYQMYVSQEGTKTVHHWIIKRKEE